MATSLSARRAWIEIFQSALPWERCLVALRKESVDRNIRVVFVGVTHFVALRKESVDRNCIYLSFFLLYLVALRKESVDRNRCMP